MGRINALQVIERFEKLDILGGQNTESVNGIVYSTSDTSNINLFT